MDCRQAHELIRCERRFADGLSAGDAAALRAHVAACPACQGVQAGEAAFDAAVRPVMVAVVVPSELPEGIRWNLRRAQRARQRARTLYTSLAAAAVLFVGVGLGWYSTRPYDLPGLYQALDNVDRGQPVPRFDPGATFPNHAGVNSWLARNGVSTAVPERLRIRHLAGAYIVSAGGRKVAVLELRDATSVSRVFLLERRYFSEGMQRKLYDEDNVNSYVIADHYESPALGWMIVGQGTPNQFVDGELPERRY
jgi:hypothetical protein